MSPRAKILVPESRPSLSRNVRLALSYFALFIFTLFALYPISRIVTIAYRFDGAVVCGEAVVESDFVVVQADIDAALGCGAHLFREQRLGVRRASLR